MWLPKARINMSSCIYYLCPYALSMQDLLSFADLPALLQPYTPQCLQILGDERAMGRTSFKTQTYLLPKEFAQWHGSGWSLLLRCLSGGFSGCCLLLGCGLRGLCALLSCLRLLSRRNIFVWFYRGDRLLFTDLEINKHISCWKHVNDELTAVCLGISWYRRLVHSRLPLHRPCKAARCSLRAALPCLEVMCQTEEANYVATHPS